MKVLLIEDNPGDVRLIEEMLAESEVTSWEVESVETLAGGLRRLEGGGIDVVLLDLNLPDSWGLGTLQKVLSPAYGVPVVVLTGLEAEYIGTEAIRAGAQDYLIKGKVDAELLTRSLNYAIERQWLAGRLRESEGVYRTLMETSPDAVVLCDLQGYVSFVSQHTAELLGYESADELLGKGAFQFLNPDEYPKAIAHLRRTVDEGTTRGVAYSIRRKDGSTFIGEVSTSLIRDDRGTPQGFVAIGRDVTESARARMRMEKMNRLFLSLGADIIDNIEKVLEAGLDILEGDEMQYCRLEKGRLSSILATRDGSEFSVTVHPETHVCALVMRRGVEEAVVIEDLRRDPRAEGREEAARQGLRSFAGYPVRPGGRTVGCLSLWSMSGRAFSVDELETLGALARMISIEEERLAREERLKDFIDVASHELRHPIAVVKGYTLTLRDKEDRLDRRARREMLEAIDRGADRLNALVLALLDTTHIERGEFTLARSEASLGALIDGSLLEIRPKEKGNVFKIDLDQDIGVLRVDPEKITRLIGVLLDNAVKFAPPGSEIEVEARLVGDEVLVSVLDRGEGIPEEERERVFERFYQVGEARHHSVPGIGLGLYIARQIVEAHGGRIWNEARAGGGTAFRFTLPRS